MQRKPVVVLISGSGSNLQALLDWSHRADSHYEIVGVLSNRPEAYGLTRAKQAGVPVAVVDHTLLTAVNPLMPPWWSRSICGNRSGWCWPASCAS